MTTLYFIRHAKPAATWGEATDAGLDDTGRAQAEQTAESLHRTLAPTKVLTSPLRRCVETSAPLVLRWAASASLLDAVAEIPSPALPMEQRRAWLAAGMKGSWRELQANSPAGSPDYLAWRTRLLDSLGALSEDTVIYSHYIAINVVVGAAQHSERVINFSPGHASVTVIETHGSEFKVRQLGEETSGGGIMLGR